MRNKDFPALPGTANSSTASSSRANPAQQWSTKTFGLENKSANENCAEPFMSPMFNQPGASRPIMDFPFMTRHTDDSSGIQISPEGLSFIVNLIIIYHVYVKIKLNDSGVCLYS